MMRNTFSICSTLYSFDFTWWYALPIVSSLVVISIFFCNVFLFYFEILYKCFSNTLHLRFSCVTSTSNLYKGFSKCKYSNVIMFFFWMSMYIVVHLIILTNRVFGVKTAWGIKVCNFERKFSFWIEWETGINSYMHIEK